MEMKIRLRVEHGSQTLQRDFGLSSLEVAEMTPRTPHDGASVMAQGDYVEALRRRARFVDELAAKVARELHAALSDAMARR